VGILYLTKPKTRLWKRKTDFTPILTEPIKEEKKAIAPSRHHLDKSELDQLAYNLDTFQADKPEKEHKIGAVAAAFEQILKEQPRKK
jgi:hypothetical protein